MQRNSEGWSPWYPKLMDVRYRAENGTDYEKGYYGKFGIDKCVWNSGITNAQKESIIELFNQNFDYRMVGYETLEEWQNMVQNTLDVVTPKYLRAFKLYNDSEIDMLNVKKRRVTEINTQNQAGGKDTNSREGKVISTPDSIINASDNYADELTKNSSETSYGRLDKRSGSIMETDEPEGGIVEEVNDNIDEWRNLIHEFVLEFERHFKQVVWY